jgi:uncharacterized protein
VLLRPPATMALYAVKASERLFDETLEYLAGRGDVELVILPRTEAQAAELRAQAAGPRFANTHFPTRVYDGPSMVWHADIVIGGGGTMNREAAALGVPVISIYEGALGAVDRRLIETGKLAHVRTIEELRRLPLQKRPLVSHNGHAGTGERLRDLIIQHIMEAVSASSREE